MRIRLLLIYLCLLPTSYSVAATDIEREQRMANEIVDSIIDGEAVYLDSGEEEYPAVIKEAPARLRAMQQAGHPKSQQSTVPGANHYFTDAGEALLEAAG